MLFYTAVICLTFYCHAGPHADKLNAVAVVNNIKHMHTHAQHTVAFCSTRFWAAGKRGASGTKAAADLSGKRCRKISDSMKWDFKWLQTF